MKKVAFLFLIFVGILIFSSCRTHKTCPAYKNGSAQVVKIEKKNV
ncbi:MAG: hypothetical protein N2Z72_04585 [Bacteroidales bacterium]|nr:hypothetical protein [Bacteroidales bacterium]